MDLNKCCGIEPIEQVRGEMKSVDHFDVWANDSMEGFAQRIPQMNEKRGFDHSDYVPEIDESNWSDIRIICRKCHRTTGWNKADAPGMPGVGRDYLQRVWNETAGA